MSGAIVLVGLSGSGKSTVGRLVADRMGLPFVDTDDVIATEAGKPVHRVFAEEGEDHFRDLESDVIAQRIVHAGACVMATGGGAVLRDTNRAMLTNGNLVVWLDAPAAALVARLHGHVATPDERPLLRGDDPLARLTAMAAARGEFYASCATMHLRSDDLTAGDIAETIIAEAERWYAAHRKEERNDD